MNKYLILCYLGFLLLNVTAGTRFSRDVSLGYNYQPSYAGGGGSNFLRPPHVISSYSPSNSASASALSSASALGSGNSYFNAAPSFNTISTTGFVPSNGQTGFFGASGSSSGGFVGSYDQQQNFERQVPIVTKHFYIHTAPEDHDEQEVVRHVNIGSPQQNYRVVFIKAPSSSASRAKIIANVAPTEDKTVIYVLAKKSNALDVSAEVVTPAPAQHKPEVFFVKYKTPAEAEHAQHVIQAQYDALGGSSNVSNEGVIPVSSVVGALGEASSNVGSIAGPPQKTYLPARQF